METAPTELGRMQELLWNVTKFNHILSYPSDAGDGAEAYAQDMVNLRVDRWGHLRLRPVIRALELANESDLVLEGTTITGIAASARALYWLTSEGELFATDDTGVKPLNIPLTAGGIRLGPIDLSFTPNLGGYTGTEADAGDDVADTTPGFAIFQDGKVPNAAEMGLGIYFSSSFETITPNTKVYVVIRLAMGADVTAFEVTATAPDSTQTILAATGNPTVSESNYDYYLLSEQYTFKTGTAFEPRSV